jgi:cytochrome oxidase Cu insertion factor (SCO1/SenC/PrrC family)
MEQAQVEETGHGKGAAFYAGLALWLLAALAGAAAAWVLLGRERLPVYWEVPDFSLTERSGRTVALADLKGKVWVAGLVYTHCPDTCPFQTAEMAKLQREFAGEKDFRLVTITVDPERDTAQALAEYARKFGADPERWLFLTGKKEAIYELAQKGFRLSSVEVKGGVRKPGPESLLRWLTPGSARAHHPGPAQPYIHSSRFVLVDREARVRGTYMGIVAPSTESKGPKGEFVPIYEEEALRRLREDIRTLLGGS